jgi:hypothetical protein
MQATARRGHHRWLLLLPLVDVVRAHHACVVL